MSEPATPQQPTPPTLGELLELSLTALANAPGVFARLAARPAPRRVHAFLVAMAWGGAFFAMNLIHIAIASPIAWKFLASAQIAMIGAVAFAAWAILYLLAASFLNGLGRALGSAGNFDRALLLACVTLAAAPVLGLCNWFQVAWVAPTLLAGWIAACGLHALFQANAWVSRAVCAALAAGALGLQYGARHFIENHLAGHLFQSAVSSAVSADSVLTPSGMVALDQRISPQSTVPGQSGLDLLRAPAEEEAAPEGSSPQTQRPQPFQASEANDDAMTKSILGMLDSLTPMLKNPNITRSMGPQQKADLLELQKMIAETKDSITSRTPGSEEERQKRMVKIQQMMMRMMSAGLAPPNPAAEAKTRAKK